MIRKYRPARITWALVALAIGFVLSLAVWWLQFADSYWRLMSGNIMYLDTADAMKCLLPWQALDCHAMFTTNGYVNVANATRKQVSVAAPWLAGVTAFCIGAYFRWFHEPYEVVIEGPAIGDRRELEKAMRQDPDQSRMELAPGLDLSRRQLQTSVAIVGGQGSGKTNLYSYVMDAIVKRGDRMILFAFKNVMVGSFPKRDENDTHAFISPDDQRSWEWDIARDVRTEAEAIRMAEYLIPNEKGEHRFFSQSARIVAIGVLKKLMAEKPGRWNWADIFAELEKPRDELTADVGAYYPIARTFLDADPRQSSATHSTVMAALMQLRLMALAWKEYDPERPKISIREFILGEELPRTLVLGRSGDFGGQSDKWISMFLGIAGDTIQSNDYPFGDERPLWFVLDEMGQLPKIDQVNRILTTGREKGVAMILGIQSVNQIVTVYDRETFDAWFANVGTKVYGRTSDGEAAKNLSKQFGETRIRKKKVQPAGTGTYNNFEERREVCYQPYDFSHRLGPKIFGVRMLVSGIALDQCEIIVPYYNKKNKEAPIRRDAFQRAAWVDEGKRMLAEQPPAVAPDAIAAAEATVDAAAKGDMKPEAAREAEAGADNDNQFEREQEEAFEKMRAYVAEEEAREARKVSR